MGSLPPITPRQRILHRCIYVSLGLSLIIFALSMVFLGLLSFFLSIVAFAFTLAFNITMLVYKNKEDKIRYVSDPGDNAPIALDQVGSQPSSHPPSSRAHIPAICRLPTIISSFVISAFWLAAFGVLVYWVVNFYKFEPSDDEYKMLGATYAEVVLVFLEAALVVFIGITALKERNQLLSNVSGRA
ncbi:hypothetical protein CC1G_02127 [Coprinopsis cinerea okayama7|uniref:Uncharacterized protein n=1 Tax=Coprinopsis cinerea (strain Okayama-7 / 130 / ATCC MYA-4618 / FGSC 9003) TaxID=240176 RepID=A8NKA2_COPC7|nr:hypothetical protein CC1G_02127 [Coprinopsis cinerea okayama7\|eukprot:XP_001834391.2 hypothetical protein CC1G_02127 [Coprinopsis cinerea okayama7\